MSPTGTTQPTLQPPDSGVTVRLYDPGFGDCLLLAFRGEDEQGRYMLIDFGVHHSYPGGNERATLVAKDIAKATGKHLHVVVITHEHTDHLYGFKHGRAHFDSIEVDDLWLAWTEDGTNETARLLTETYGLRIRALAAAVHRLGSDEPLSAALRNVLHFEPPEALAATGGKAAQLTYLRARSKRKLERAEDYCHPKNPPLDLPGVKGVKVYVLGPPEDVSRIRNLEKKSEMYPELAALDEVDAFVAAALADEDPQRHRSTCPFEQSYGIALGEARSHAVYGRFFRSHYGFSNHRSHGPAWRRINTDWLAAAGQLALDINRKTNNTSLVLAVELPGTQPQKVLLFAADAQVGNWLSWHDLEWPGEGSGDEPLKVKDLLRRTVLYKVGHHGSRNATLRWQGLEMMQSTDLVALLPVDEHWARTTQGWEHPADKLLERLKDKTRGRILRSDQIPQGEEPPAKPAEATEEEWQAFLAQLDWDRGPQRLWIQYTVGP
jgi:beta-lactamase superfamily II metal-dependent hydrolase